MNRISAIAWKEWHESRAFFFLALAVFIGLPLIGGLEYAIAYHRAFSTSASPWVVFFGGVLAIFVGVGTTCRDFHGRLDDFWRSRPVSPLQWLAVKYVIGLLVVIASCVLPLLLDWVTNRSDYLDPLILLFPFVWCAIFSIGFLAGCLIRRTAHAAMLALAAMLLIYFVPIVIPPLRAFDITTITYFMRYPGLSSNRTENAIIFIAGMLGLAAVLLSISLIAVRRDWHIDSGRKTMYGSISAAFLLLFASAAFQLGTNLPILQQVDFPAGEEAQILRCHGTSGFVVTRKPYNVYTTPDGYVLRRFNYFFHPIQVSANGVHLGEGRRVAPPHNLLTQWLRGFSPTHPEIEYQADDYVDQGTWYCDLSIQDLSSPRGWNKMNLWNQKTDMEQVRSSQDLTIIDQNRLFVLPVTPHGIEHVLMLDISTPLAPRLISNTALKAGQVAFGIDFSWDAPANQLHVYPNALLGLSAQQHMAAMLNFWGAFDGQIFATRSRDGIVAYRLEKIDHGEAVFDKIGQYKPSLLETVFGEIMRYYPQNTLQIGNGELYAASGGDWQHTINSRITVFDLSGPQPMRVIGHFAAPTANLVCPLPDGRALVAGNKLWLVGPPPAHD